MQRVKKRLITSVLVASLGLVTSCANISSSTADASDQDSNKLKIMLSDAEVDQQSRLSQMRADLLRQNQGYLDSDEVTVILELQGSSLIDYNLGLTNPYGSVADYALSSAGTLNSRAISSTQSSLIDRLKGQKLIKSVEHQYQTVINGIAVRTTYGNLETLNDFQGVKRAVLAETYNRPEAVSGVTSSVTTNDVDVYETGIFDSSDVSYNGEGTAVAILDSGFDCSHSVFKDQPQNPLLSRDDVAGLLPRTNAAKTTAGLKITDVWYSDKIPYTYDYADKDDDVNPYDSEHGTHVAGIIGGHDDVITGVAPHTQLVLMKVFPDLDDGAKTDDILAGLEDAVLLEVDAINMSLGSACGFTREADGDPINDVYDRINASGISLITAASNNYSSGYGSANGNTSKVWNPDSATVGSPSTYAGALSVASISGTKSKYIVANGDQTFFFNESNDMAGKPYDFFDGIGLPASGEKTFEYVTVPGVGMKINYTGLDVRGKIALVRRGDNTFEEKARLAHENGAIACIIYNNVNGDILMSMGKTNPIPTISISKDVGTALASRATGTMAMSRDMLAGPFMSDFSSWGPTPDLKLKPEITAHGGNIKSSIPGGGYDELSGTSMASPNMCGIIVLIRQYLKEKYPAKTHKEISVMANELLMSTATIALDQVGNPYSPRKQGAGLASLRNAVKSGAYITVDGSDRSKLELGDDPKRTGVYEMNFNVVSIADKALTYDVSALGMTESVATSDKDFVAEMGQILGGATKVELLSSSGAEIDGTKVTVAAGATAKIKVTYTLSDADRKTIDDSFKYGEFVEGFVRLKAADSDSVDLNAPFLAFYGDWTEAPLFDKTYFEVESEAHNDAIDEEDKLKADYYATTPYGNYFYNYIIPLGSYIYDMDESMYDPIPASADKIAISTTLGAIDGISSIYAGLLRNAKEMIFTITDTTTGEVIYNYVDVNANKSHSYGSDPVPYYEFLKIHPYQLGLANNTTYEFTMTARLDYGDGGAAANVRNSFGFQFTVDEDAPILKNAEFEKVYDRTLKKDRFYLNLTVYDNHYVQSVQPVIFTSNSTYTTLSDNPIPVYGEKNSDSTVRFEITDYLDQLYSDALAKNSFAILIDDYALNSNIFLVDLPGTGGKLQFTQDGTAGGAQLSSLTAYTEETTDLIPYLSSSDPTLDQDKDYLKHLTWTSSNEKIAVVKDGQIKGVSPGRVTVTVTSSTFGVSKGKASLIVVIKDKSAKNIKRAVADPDVALEKVSFSYFDTVYAHKLAGGRSDINQTGTRNYFTKGNNVSFYPGEIIKIQPLIEPWYLPSDRYELVWSSTNESVATVDQDGTVRALKKGSCAINLNVIVDGVQSNIMASAHMTVNSEFIIENRTLTAYKGLGGDVVIPDDEGILYIGAYAFCLYDTDHTSETPENDYDANKTPGTNNTVTSVVVPEGVEEIQKYAFYNCDNLESVELPSSLKTIREYAFKGDVKLANVTGDLAKVQVIGAYAFADCGALSAIELGGVYAIGERAFFNCTSLAAADLSSLRNSGKEIFRNTSALKRLKLDDATILSYGMFVNSGLEDVTLGVRVIPDFCFADCASLATVTVVNDLVSVGKGAFSGCPVLTEVVFGGQVEWIYDQAFYNCLLLQTLDLPNSAVKLGSNVFYKCPALETLGFKENTLLESVGGSLLEDTAVSRFVVAAANQYYSVSADGILLTDKAGRTVILAAPGADYGAYTVKAAYEAVASGAFSGVASLTSVTFENPNILIGAYAFAGCPALKSVVFPAEKGADDVIIIDDYAFNGTVALESVTNLEQVDIIGAYAFAQSNLPQASIGAGAKVGEGAFLKSELTEVTLGADVELGFGAFQNCAGLTTVNMPDAGGVKIGPGAFSHCVKLRTIDLSKTGEELGDEAFFDCQTLRTANLTNVKVIGRYAFGDCGALENVTIPAAVTIGEGAFSRYSQGGSAPAVETVVFPDTLVSIGDGAFLGSGLTAAVLPSSLTYLGSFAFSNCAKLVTVALPASIDTLGQYTFYMCQDLESINTGELTEIGDYALGGCFNLSSVDLSKVVTIGEAGFIATPVRNLTSVANLVSVGEGAFQGVMQGNTLYSPLFAEFDAPKLEYIGDLAFSNCYYLNRFVFSSRISHVGMGAFYLSSRLQEFAFRSQGNMKDEGTINDYAYLEGGALYVKLPSGAWQFQAYPAARTAKTLTVKEGTVRIDTYAGNQNKNVTTIVLPNSLKLIGNHAFRDFSALQTVEFRSFNAPTLESNYVKDETLSETDPGYPLLHPYEDVFGIHYYFAQFIDLVGKHQPIKMILPSNPDVSGYDTVIYEAFFGKVSAAERSSFVAPDNKTEAFIAAMARLPEDGTSVTLADEAAVLAAVTARNALVQDLTTVGYTAEEVAALEKRLADARETIRLLNFAGASETVKNLQADIDALDPVFDIAKLPEYQSVSSRLAALSYQERQLLDLSNYEALQAGYQAYLESIEGEIVEIRQVALAAYDYVVLAAAVSLVVLGAAVLAVRKFY